MLEKDIETAFIEWLPTSPFPWKVLGRQVDVGCGTADIVCYQTQGNAPVVIEVKRGKTPKDTVSQLFGYMHALQWQTTLLGPSISNPQGYIVAESLDPMTERLVTQGGVGFIRYEIDHTGISFRHEFIYSKSIEKPSSPVIANLIASLKVGYIEEERKQVYQRIDFDGGRYFADCLPMIDVLKLSGDTR
jgi:hypothetical protein